MKTHKPIHVIDKVEMARIGAHLRENEIYYLAGSSSIYVPSWTARYKDRAVCKLWPDLGGQSRLMTPGEAARTELKREWPKLKKVGWPGKTVKLLKARSPMHYGGEYSGRMILVDLDAAYCQIYRRLWLDTSFPRGYYGKYPLFNLAHRLHGWKLARNALIGIARSTTCVGYKGPRRIVLKTKNRYLAPPLWATIQAILHWIADLALRSGAIYVNVDGYIFPDNYVGFAEEFMYNLSSLGFDWSIRATGEGEIASWNNYQIGTFKTQLYKLGVRHNSKEFSNVSVKDAKQWGHYWRGLGNIYGETVKDEDRGS